MTSSCPRCGYGLPLAPLWRPERGWEIVAIDYDDCVTVTYSHPTGYAVMVRSPVHDGLALRATRRALSNLADALNDDQLEAASFENDGGAP